MEEKERVGWGKGEEIFSKWEPWVAIVLGIKGRSYCQGCFYTNKCPSIDIECDNCGLVSYCSWGCRAQDKFHQLECNIFAREGRLPRRDEVRVMIRAIRKLKMTGGKIDCISEGGGKGDFVPGRAEKRRFRDLLSWKESFLGNREKKEDIQVVYDETEEFLGDDMPNFDQFMEVLGRLYINGFEICDENMDTYGWAVYLGPSILDHSCQPNCVVSFSGSRLTVKTLTAIHSLDEAFITYLDPSLPGPVRRAKMEQDYFFTCNCVKCRHSQDSIKLSTKNEGGKKKRQRGRR